MSERPLTAQLDQVIARVLAGEEPAPVRSKRLGSLVRLAGNLRDLPREQFRERLKNDLLNKGATTSMSTATAVKESASYVREGFLNVTPYLISKRGPEVLDFIKQAFGAQETLRVDGLASGMHAEARIGDAMVMLGGGPQYQLPAQTCALHIHVPDADATYARALELGATSLAAPVDQPYGERGGGVTDVAGNIWYIATVKGASFHWPGLPQLQPYFHAKGAAAFLDLLARVFDGQIEGRHDNPDGSVAHAQVRIGTATVEISDARGPYQPLPSMLYVYVPNADAVYNRALDAGCTSVHPVADQPYGDRNGAIRDPFGNTWYVATHRGAA
jgi:PhnB protein